jgi:hypothetical protein
VVRLVIPSTKQIESRMLDLPDPFLEGRRGKGKESAPFRHCSRLSLSHTSQYPSRVVSFAYGRPETEKKQLTSR